MCCSRTLWVSPTTPPPEAGSLFCCLNSQKFFQSEVLRLLPCAATLGCTVFLTLQFFLLVYPHANMGLPAPPASALLTPVLQLLPCCKCSPPWLPMSAPHTSLDECFFFNSLVVGLPYSSIFCQFWLFFVFKFVVVLLLVVRGGKVYLPMPPLWPEAANVTFFSLNNWN